VEPSLHLIHAKAVKEVHTSVSVHLALFRMKTLVFSSVLQYIYIYNDIYIYLIYIEEQYFCRSGEFKMPREAEQRLLTPLNMTMGYFSFSFLINYKKILHRCFFLSRWGAK